MQTESEKKIVPYFENPKFPSLTTIPFMTETHAYFRAELVQALHATMQFSPALCICVSIIKGMVVFTF